MTISSSLNAGVSGLSANASRLSTIADNIANSGTNGYKRAETEFHAMVISNHTGNYSAGGVRVSSQRMIDQAGSLLSSTNATDLAVRGRGFIPITTEAAVNLGDDTDLPFRLATTGSFRTDSEGYLTTEMGMVLMAWPADADGTVPTFPRDTAAGLVPVQINVNQFGGQPTTRMGLAVNLPATESEAGASGDTLELSVDYFDNLGTSQNLFATYTPIIPATGASNQWVMELSDSASGGAIVGEYTLTFDDSRTGGGTLIDVTRTSAVGQDYNPATGSIDVMVDGGPLEITIGELGSGSGLTQLSDSFSPTQITKDGSPVGNLTSVDVDANGFVRATFDIGISRTIYQIPLVNVSNVNGLNAMDNQTYTPSDDSGSFFLWDAGDGPTGDVVGYAVEESTTDVAGELTALIQTQRAYSSNAKVIQTVDEMLQETTNIKR